MIRDLVLRKLQKEIEEKHNVRVLYACESGSRAWGFPGKDSDYDIRFIYAHPEEWYLSIGHRYGAKSRANRDAISLPIEDNLDFAGWDLQKALHLYSKSNPSLAEWIYSPVVYLEAYGVVDALRKMSPKYYDVRSAIYHYRHMAENNYRDFISKNGDNGDVSYKKYLYILRPLIAVRFLEEYGIAVPTSFEVLLQEVKLSQNLRGAINTLIFVKRYMPERNIGKRIPVVDAFIESEISRDVVLPSQLPKRDHADLDKLFRDSLNTIWGVL